MRWRWPNWPSNFPPNIRGTRPCPFNLRTLLLDSVVDQLHIILLCERNGFLLNTQCEIKHQMGQYCWHLRVTLHITFFLPSYFNHYSLSIPTTYLQIINMEGIDVTSLRNIWDCDCLLNQCAASYQLQVWYNIHVITHAIAAVLLTLYKI